MSYIHKHLIEDEDIIFQTRIHWIIFIPWVLMTIVVLLLLFYFRDFPVYVFIIRVVAALLFVKAIASNIIYWTAEYGVTTKRVLGKTGLMRIQSLDILLLKVEAVRLSQGLLGRILNFGDVIVTGTGGTQEILYDLPDPMKVRSIIQSQANKVHEQSTVSSAT